jgi:hypothetical protein
VLDNNTGHSNAKKAPEIFNEFQNVMMSERTKCNCNDVYTNEFYFKIIEFWDVTSHILVNRRIFWRNLMPPSLSPIKEAAGSSKH